MVVSIEENYYDEAGLLKTDGETCGAWKRVRDVDESFLWFKSPKIVSYNGFSGISMRAIKDNIVICDVQAISIETSREVTPIYTMGDAPMPGWDCPLEEIKISGTLMLRPFQDETIEDGFDIEFERADKHGSLSFMKLEDVQLLGDEIEEYKQIDYVATLKAENIWHAMEE